MSHDKELAARIAAEHLQALRSQNPNQSPAEAAYNLNEANKLGNVAATISAFMGDNPGVADRVYQAGIRLSSGTPSGVKLSKFSMSVIGLNSWIRRV